MMMVGEPVRKGDRPPMTAHDSSDTEAIAADRRSTTRMVQTMPATKKTSSSTKIYRWRGVRGSGRGSDSPPRDCCRRLMGGAVGELIELKLIELKSFPGGER